MYSRIAGTGSYLPERILTNAELETMVETTSEWIVTRTGIERRHIAAPHESTSSMATEAARKAMQAAGVGPSDIDLVIVGTTTPDRVFPNVGCLVANALGLGEGPAFSVEAACSGFIYALSIADKFIRGGESKCALVIGAETLSRITDWTDRQTCVLFGDGAGAVILKPSEEPGIISTHLNANGVYKDLLYSTGGVSCPKDSDDHGGEPRIKMRGNEVFKVAVTKLGEIVEQTLAANNLRKEDIDWLIPHQANNRIITATARKLGMSMDKVVLTVQDQGNTSAASVPLALDLGVTSGKLKRGELLLLEAFGGGFTWGSALIRY
jgi:3-oxoacyl-[acyl-carrier-protein] synthase-3